MSDDHTRKLRGNRRRTPRRHNDRHQHRSKLARNDDDLKHINQIRLPERQQKIKAEHINAQAHRQRQNADERQRFDEREQKLHYEDFCGSFVFFQKQKRVPEHSPDVARHIRNFNELTSYAFSDCKRDFCQKVFCTPPRRIRERIIQNHFFLVFLDFIRSCKIHYSGIKAKIQLFYPKNSLAGHPAPHFCHSEQNERE